MTKATSFSAKRTSKCQGKWARSDPRPPCGPPEVLVAVHMPIGSNGSRTTDLQSPRHVRFSPVSDRIAAQRQVTRWAMNGLMHRNKIEEREPYYRLAQLPAAARVWPTRAYLLNANRDAERSPRVACARRSPGSAGCNADSGAIATR
jgi:hypothetical protein